MFGHLQEHLIEELATFRPWNLDIILLNCHMGKHYGSVVLVDGVNYKEEGPVSRHRRLRYTYWAQLRLDREDLGVGGFTGIHKDSEGSTIHKDSQGKSEENLR